MRCQIARKKRLDAGRRMLAPRVLSPPSMTTRSGSLGAGTWAAVAGLVAVLGAIEGCSAPSIPGHDDLSLGDDTSGKRSKGSQSEDSPEGTQQDSIELGQGTKSSEPPPEADRTKGDEGANDAPAQCTVDAECNQSGRICTAGSVREGLSYRCRLRNERELQRGADATHRHERRVPRRLRLRLRHHLHRLEVHRRLLHELRLSDRAGLHRGPVQGDHHDEHAACRWWRHAMQLGRPVQSGAERLGPDLRCAGHVRGGLPSRQPVPRNEDLRER